MAFPLLLLDESPSTAAHVTAARFTRRRTGARERHNSFVDAAWWPQSFDLTAESPDLLEAARRSDFAAARLRFCLEDGWLAAPRTIAFHGRQIKVSGYHNHHANMITLIDGTSHERLQVMVIPPDTSRAIAERALQIAARQADPAPAVVILALARTEIRAAGLHR